MTFSPDGLRLAIAVGEKGSATLYSWPEAQRLTTMAAFPGGGSQVWVSAFIQWSPDGKRLLTCGRSPRAMLWSASDGSKIADLASSEPAIVAHAIWSSDGALLATASENGEVRVWDGKTGEVRFKPIEPGVTINSICFDRSAERIGVACADARGRIYALATAAQPIVLSHKDEDVFGDLEVGDIAFDSTGERVVTTSFGFHEIRCWNSRTGAELWRSDFGSGNEGGIGAWFSEDGKQVCSNRAGRVIDAVSGKVISESADSLERFYRPLGKGLLLASSQRAIFSVIEETGQRTRYTFLARKNGGWLLSTPEGFVDGSLSALREARVLSGTQSDPFETHASALFDPKRAHAAAHGVTVQPAAPR